MRISVVIPMYNEEKGIEQSLRTLHAALEKELAPSDFEILAVNDGSTDRTGALVGALDHGAELMDAEMFSVLGDPLLPVKNRAGGVQLNGDHQHQQHRGQHYDAQGR